MTDDETTTTDEPAATDDEPEVSAPATAGAHPEPVSSAGKVFAWNCSAGDFEGRATADEVLEHIAAEHSEVAPKARSRRR